METISGVVEKTSMQFSPQGATKKWQKKSLLVNGEWFSAFLNKDNRAFLEPLKEGDLVKVQFKIAGNFKNVEKVELVAAHTPASPTAGEEKSFTDSVNRLNDKDRRITYLASRKDALELVKAIIQVEGFKLPVKMAERADAILGFVREYTELFTKDAYGETVQEAGEEAKGTSENDGE